MTMIINKAVYREHIGAVLRNYLDEGSSGKKYPPVEVFLNHTAYNDFDKIFNVSPARALCVALEALNSATEPHHFEAYAAIQERVDSVGLTALCVDMANATVVYRDMQNIDSRSLSTTVKIFMAMYKTVFLMDDELTRITYNALTENLDMVLDGIVGVFATLSPKPFNKTFSVHGEFVHLRTYGDDNDKELSKLFDEQYNFDDFEYFLRNCDRFPHALQQSKTYEQLSTLKALI